MWSFSQTYLQSSDDVEAFKGQRLHIEHRIVPDSRRWRKRPQVLLYDKPFVLSYLQPVRHKAQETIARESAEALAGPSGFRRGANARGRSCTFITSGTFNIMLRS